ncbi:hypothetical protein PVL29_003007 [Vitis rotundifolia]|uniref:AAA+ ATPase domain-containing protein n=4 Tax=Vitis rotundifolia TaxID=103349 RepID=A0AA39E1J0_VITRO|nr:hypothetical protein PVL29_003007 [Vitis rotundifolia]
MDRKNFQMPSTKTMISAAASLAGSAMLIRSIIRDLIPPELQHYLFSRFRGLLGSFTSEFTLVIEEFDGFGHNQLFRAAEVYLGSVISPNAQRLRVTLPNKESKMSITMDRNEDVADTFNGVSLKWTFISRSIPTRYFNDPDNYYSMAKSELKFFQLSFHKKHKQMVLETYLPYVLEKFKSMKETNKTLKIHTLKFERLQGGSSDPWQSVKLDHPATFDTLAMDSELKRTLMNDLERFVKRKGFYRKVGKAWKRGYLLFGPPGTGKSSLIAAMANYLNFDIYDLELTDLRCNSELRKLLISTANRSILVVEDIDCSLELQDRLAQARMMNPHRYQTSQVTLSGLLNFIDGLWSSCGDERIIVFTTNHKDKLDPALLRPGRMDMHINMSYCTPCGFKMLASNYLEITNHPLFPEVENLILEAKVTPAEVGEQLMKSEVPDITLEGLIRFLVEKKESDAAKAREAELEAARARDKEEKEKDESGKPEKGGEVEIKMIR